MITTVRKSKIFVAVVASTVVALMFSTLPVSALPNEGEARALATDTLPRLTPCPTSVTGIGTLQVSLDGTWRFNTAPPEEFWKSGPSVGDGWSTIDVPGEWVMQNFTVAENTAAGYWREFMLPVDWEGQRVKLRCDAVYSDATVWVNGRLAGRHEGGFTPFELDVTDLIQLGKGNTVALAVKNESVCDALASGTQYAAHPLGGITRNIYLFAVPEMNIASLHVETTFDEAYTDATLRVLLNVANESIHDITDAHVSFALQAWGTDGKPRALGTRDLPRVNAGDVLRTTLEFPVANPRKWDPEHPNLYELTCHLEVGGNRVETVSRRFGFRQIEVRGNEVFVNNRPINLRGVCRHETHPLRGRSLTPELWRKDAELFRDANVNLIRTSHYPPAEEFLDACDELGIFVEDEAPFCWAFGRGHRDEQDNPGFAAPVLRQTLELVERDRSHPCVLLWSLGNESRWGSNFALSAMAVKQVDPTRPRTFTYGMRNDDADRDYCEIGAYHYPGIKGMEKFIDNDRPVLFDEYCHLNCYNRREILTDPGVRDLWGRALAAMWEKMYDSNGILGGAIWAGIDDVFYLPGGETVGYGTWGPLDGWRREKPEYWHVKKVYSPIRLLTKEVPVPADGKPIRLQVANRHDFTNLEEIRIEWAVADESGTVSADIPPRSIGDIILPPLTGLVKGDVLSLNFASPRGFLIDAYALPLGSPEHPGGIPEKRARDAVLLTETKPVFKVSGTRFNYTFDRSTGQITNAEIDGSVVVIGGPVLMILPLTKERGGQIPPEKILPLNDTCHEWRARSVEAKKTDDIVEISVKGRHQEAAGGYTITIDGTGALKIDYRFKCLTKINPRQIGIVFTLPRSFDTLAWKRNAQWSVYPDDHIGRPEGVARASHEATSDDVRDEPSCPWALDANQLGTNDFRSSKHKIHDASLTNANGAGVMVQSDGSQTVRAFLDGNRVGLLVADYSNSGGERFLSSHYESERRPLGPDSVVAGSVHLELIAPTE